MGNGARGNDEPEVAVTVDHAADVVVDGRTARAVRTRDALVEATMALVEEGDLRPTAPRIAERAGVSVRSVFQHFDDLETLFSALGDRAFARVASLVGPIDTESPLPLRIDRFVTERCQINEAITPINRAAILQAPTSETINRQFRHGHRMAAGHLAESFAPELAKLGSRADELLDALVVVTSWTSWNLLRTLERRDEAEATAIIRRSVDLLFVGAGLSPTSHGLADLPLDDGSD
ncbi:MAG: TetR/AcrR family transcriptional regulator [Acidimicrobiales bacterium]|nr:TetR/AcrR family transcriptional regulator [Acidimicrobiales bacterium]